MIKLLQRFATPILIFTLFCIISGVLFLGLRKNTQSFNFQDETDHVAVGWMMNNFDKSLYIDLSTNHQPIPVLLGALLMKIISFGTLFELIERIRISMFVFHFLAGAFLVWRFKEKGLFATLLTHSVGYYFFAWHVLAESIAIPAVIYLVLLVLERVLTKTTVSDQQRLVDTVLAALALVWCGFTLLPLAPFCVLAAGALFLTATKKERIYAASTALIAVAAMFSFISPSDWYRETIYNNTHFWIAYEEPLSAAQWFAVALFPFLSFLKPFNRNSLMLSVPILILLGGWLYRYFKNHSSLKKINFTYVWKAAFVYLLLISLNSRIYEYPVAFWTGFHLYPFIAGFFSIFGVVFFETFKAKKALHSAALVLVILPLIVLNTPWILEDKDKLNEYHVQYGTRDSYAQLIAVFKTEGDTFFSGSDGYGYMNITSGLPIAGRQLFHLQWAYRSPELRTEFHEMLEHTPPPFVYFTEDTSGYHTDFQPVLKAGYSEVLQYGKKTHLYFSNAKIANITEQQRQYMEEKDFTFAQSEL